MKKINTLIQIAVYMIFVFSLFFVGNVSAQLSPDAQFDLLKQRAMSQLKDEKWVDAISTIEQLERSGQKLEIDFSYFKGKALVESGKGSLALKPLEHYINTAGSSGKGYANALTLYGRAQVQAKATQQRVQAQQKAQREKREKAQAKARAQARVGPAKAAYAAGKGKTTMIPAGSFRMGYAGFTSSEPIHSVRINYKIEIGVYEVTWAQWETCVTDGGCKKYDIGDQGFGRGNRPVIGTSWNAAQAFITWLNKTAGEAGFVGGWRLPSEAEWEYAARAGSTKRFPWGTLSLHKHANFGENEHHGGGRAAGRDYWVNTSPVGSFPPNEFGLYDTVSNASEWVHDCWHENYSRAPRNGAAWTSGGDCTLRVMRGGNFQSAKVFTVSAARSSGEQNSRYKFTGFRIARTRK